MKKIAIITLSIILNLQVSAQENPKKCLTTSIVKKELENNPEYRIMKQNLFNYQKENTENNYKTKATITIPVVIHIVHRTQDNIGNNTNISKLQIEDQLRILNEDFSKTNSEFPNPPRSTFISYAGNPDIKFCLATTDPDGNSTTGITRTPTSKTSWDADDDDEKNYMKRSNQGGIDNWDPLRYMNIWVCNLSNSLSSGQTLGYAYLPGLQNSSQSWLDGLVVDYKWFGTIGNASSSSDGRTPTHEIGHYLGLSHTFCEDGGCCDNDNNSQWGLSVDDTPAADDNIYFGTVNANTNNNTCDDTFYGFGSDLLDMDENYMSYASDTWMFSNGQAAVMNDVLSASTWQGGRSELKNSTVSVNCTGLIGTGLNNYQIENLNIYPNPTLGKLNIASADKINSISITNIIGEEILFAKDFSANTIDLSSYKSGVYFINISTNKGTHIEKIILTK